MTNIFLTMVYFVYPEKQKNNIDNKIAGKIVLIPIN